MYNLNTYEKIRIKTTLKMQIGFSVIPTHGLLNEQKGRYRLKD